MVLVFVTIIRHYFMPRGVLEVVSVHRVLISLSNENCSLCCLFGLYLYYSSISCYLAWFNRGNCKVVNSFTSWLNLTIHKFGIFVPHIFIRPHVLFVQAFQIICGKRNWWSSQVADSRSNSDYMIDMAESQDCVVFSRVPSCVHEAGKWLLSEKFQVGVHILVYSKFNI